MQFESEHVKCGGKLHFHHKQRVTKRGRTITKNMHLCDKCGAMVNVITMPSYEEYVLMGYIWVDKDEYYRIKQSYKRGRKK